MRSILRAYSGEEDDTGNMDPLQARDVNALYSPTTQGEKIKRFKSTAASLKTQLPEPTNVSVLSAGLVVGRAPTRLLRGTVL